MNSDAKTNQKKKMVEGIDKDRRRCVFVFFLFSGAIWYLIFGSTNAIHKYLLYR